MPWVFSCPASGAERFESDLFDVGEVAGPLDVDLQGGYGHFNDVYRWKLVSTAGQEVAMMSAGQAIAPGRGGRSYREIIRSEEPASPPPGSGR